MKLVWMLVVVATLATPVCWMLLTVHHAIALAVIPFVFAKACESMAAIKDDAPSVVGPVDTTNDAGI